MPVAPKITPVDETNTNTVAPLGRPIFGYYRVFFQKSFFQKQVYYCLKKEPGMNVCLNYVCLVDLVRTSLTPA